MKSAVLCVLLMLSSGFVSGQDEIGAQTAHLTEIVQVESSLEEEEREISGTLALDGSYDAHSALGRLWRRLLDKACEAAKEELGFIWKLVMISLLCSIAVVLSPEQKIGKNAEMAACCAAAMLLAGRTEGVLDEARAALYRLSDYGKAAFPAFYMTVAACGASASASVKYASVSFVMNVFMELTRRFLLPLIHAYLAVAITCSIAENALLQGVERLLKWCCATMMTVFTGGFCTYISLTGLISGSADAAAVKAAKAVISTALPVVGGILSDSAATMLSAASVIKNSAGVFCLIAVCTICAGPFVLLLVKMLALKAAAAISGLGSCERYARLLSSVGNGMGMLLGLVGSYGMMLFFSFMSGLRMTT